MHPRPVPVLMYHSVVPAAAKSPIPWLVYPLELFERFVASLARKGYHTPTMDELHAHLQGRELLPDRSIVLTFDDGYLDTWYYVEPVLRAHGLRGVVWVTRDFVESGDERRPQPEPSQPVPHEELWRFLNRAELRSLDRGSVLEVQSHATTHTWWFSGPRIVDYHRPESVRPWMSWNAAPERKTRWMVEDQADIVPWGTPVYENARAMVRRYVPDPELDSRIVGYVAEHGGASFFERAAWRDELDALGQDFRRARGERGEFESDEAWTARVTAELDDVRHHLAHDVGIELTHHCWPGGDCNDRTERIALDLGYRTTTVKGEKNVFGKSNPDRVDRISAPLRWSGGLYRLNLPHLEAKVEAYRGTFPYGPARRALRGLRGLHRGTA